MHFLCNFTTAYKLHRRNWTTSSQQLFKWHRIRTWTANKDLNPVNSVPLVPQTVKTLRFSRSDRHLQTKVATPRWSPLIILSFRVVIHMIHILEHSVGPHLVCRVLYELQPGHLCATMWKWMFDRIPQSLQRIQTWNSPKDYRSEKKKKAPTSRFESKCTNALQNVPTILFWYIWGTGVAATWIQMPKGLIIFFTRKTAVSFKIQKKLRQSESFTAWSSLCHTSDMSQTDLEQTGHENLQRRSSDPSLFFFLSFSPKMQFKYYS